MLGDGWVGLLRILATGTIAYGALIIIVRSSGKRTLAKLSAFDFLVTVALGSCLATVLLSRSTALVEGLTGLLLLVGLQFAVSWLAVRSRVVRRWIKSEPVLLFRQGAFLDEQLKSERIGRDDVLAAIRKAGIADLTETLAVVLEADGTMSVMRGRDAPRDSTLLDVKQGRSSDYKFDRGASRARSSSRRP